MTNRWASFAQIKRKDFTFHTNQYGLHLSGSHKVKVVTAIKDNTPKVISVTASISDINNSSTPLLLPSPSSSQADNNSNPLSATGPTSTSSSSDNNVDSNKQNSTNNNGHHNSRSISQSNIGSDNNNHGPFDSVHLQNSLFQPLPSQHVL